MFKIFGFYKFKRLNLLNKHKILFQKLFTESKIKGTMIISKEGLNGSLSGNSKDISTIKNKIKLLLKIDSFDSENISKSKFFIALIIGVCLVPRHCRH